MMKMDYINGWQ